MDANYGLAKSHARQDSPAGTKSINGRMGQPHAEQIAKWGAVEYHAGYAV